MRKIIISVAIVITLLAGLSITAAAVVASIADGSYSDPGLTKEIAHNKPDYETNNDGKTFGSSADVMYVEDLPDLIAVVGDNGKEGFVYADEFIGDVPSSLDEIKLIRESMRNGTYVPKVYNVYESDGKTIIDTFTEHVES